MQSNFALPPLNSTSISPSSFSIFAYSLIVAAGIAAVKSQNYYTENCKKIAGTRDFTVKELEKTGFEVIPSKANFIFARSPKISGEELYLRLKSEGILVRHFTAERIKDFNRITIGTPEQMETLIEKIKNITEAV